MTDEHEVFLNPQCDGIWVECSCGQLSQNLGIPTMEMVEAAAQTHLFMVKIGVA